MAIIRWEPINTARLFNRWPSVLDEEEWPEMTMTDGLDVYETDKEVVVEAAMPGIPEDQINVTFEDGVLRIQGRYEETDENKKKKKSVYRQQMVRSFDYTTTLPRAVDANKISADCEGGIVKITAPIAEESKPKKIEVKVKK